MTPTRIAELKLSAAQERLLREAHIRSARVVGLGNQSARVLRELGLVDADIEKGWAKMLNRMAVTVTDLGRAWLAAHPQQEAKS